MGHFDRGPQTPVMFDHIAGLDRISVQFHRCCPLLWP
jgi:hypothetical protein